MVDNVKFVRVAVGRFYKFVIDSQKRDNEILRCFYVFRSHNVRRSHERRIEDNGGRVQRRSSKCAYVVRLHETFYFVSAVGKRKRVYAVFDNVINGFFVWKLPIAALNVRTQ